MALNEFYIKDFKTKSKMSLSSLSGYNIIYEKLKGDRKEELACLRIDLLKVLEKKKGSVELK